MRNEALSMAFRVVNKLHMSEEKFKLWIIQSGGKWPILEM
jgi:hypothetical protein